MTFPDYVVQTGLWEEFGKVWRRRLEKVWNAINGV
jgi:hypothetical protein